MPTDKKHIAVYLEPAVETALVAFCEHEKLKSKKGLMYSAAVNSILANFFCVPRSKRCACGNIIEGEA